ncbi:MAG: phenylacetate--CoA ligase family protein [Polyangiaceae bacterium]|nr:phenylacetate--CoA ligase family protein [Polyangiaceae bacterium]
MDVALIARVLWMRRALRSRERWSAERLAAHRAGQLELLRRHAFARSPFYRRFHHGLEMKPLHELPILTKTELMSNFDELVTDRAVRLADVRAHLQELKRDEAFLDRYRVTRTAGSTGNPGIFLSDAREWASIIASYSRAQEWAGVIPHLTSRTRLAVVSSRVPSHQSARVSASVDAPFLPVRRFDSTEPLEAIVLGLNAWQPVNLIAYASMARILAEEQLAGRLQISPKVVMSASEVLTPESRGRIWRAWGREPFDVYAATETATIASECSIRRLHLFEDLVITEVVDERNRSTPPGEFGAKLLVTVLFSRTQPLIRYEISDRVMLAAERCACGLPFALLSGIEGRAEDILRLPSQEGGVVAIHPNVFHNLLERLPVQAWQVLEEPDAIRILLSRPSGDIDVERLTSNVASALQQRGAVGRPVRIERVESVIKTTLGKAPLVKAWRSPQSV